MEERSTKAMLALAQESSNADVQLRATFVAHAKECAADIEAGRQEGAADITAHRQACDQGVEAQRLFCVASAKAASEELQLELQGVQATAAEDRWQMREKLEQELSAAADARQSQLATVSQQVHACDATVA